MPKIFLMVQFTFRFLELINLFFTLVASINISIAVDKYSIFPILIVLFMAVSDIIPIIQLYFQKDAESIRRKVI
jgi:hypothetical protein